MTEFLVGDGFCAGGGLRFRAAIGRAGVVERKLEGDGGTPAGRLRLVRVLYRGDRIRAPNCTVPVEPIGKRDGWCDDVADAAYNRMVTLPYGARSEELWRTDGLYDIVGVLDWNMAPAIRGRGSAIFLHVATADYAPTAGCVALSLADLLVCLAANLSSLRAVAA